MNCRMPAHLSTKQHLMDAYIIPVQLFADEILQGCTFVVGESPSLFAVHIEKHMQMDTFAGLLCLREFNKKSVIDLIFRNQI